MFLVPFFHPSDSGQVKLQPKVLKPPAVLQGHKHLNDAPPQKYCDGWKKNRYKFRKRYTRHGQGPSEDTKFFVIRKLEAGEAKKIVFAFAPV